MNSRICPYPANQSGMGSLGSALLTIPEKQDKMRSEIYVLTYCVTKYESWELSDHAADHNNEKDRSGRVIWT